MVRNDIKFFQMKYTILFRVSHSNLFSGINLKVMDECHVSLADLRLSSSFFEFYRCDEKWYVLYPRIFYPWSCMHGIYLSFEESTRYVILSYPLPVPSD